MAATTGLHEQRKTQAKSVMAAIRQIGVYKNDGFSRQKVRSSF